MSAILLEKHEHIATLTLNQPKLRNSISEIEVVDAFVDALNEVEQDSEIRCLIITGAGSAFSSGGNIKHMLNKEGMFAGDANDIRESYKRVIQRIPLALYNFPLPTIAAVNGPAIGAGCDLAMYCDMRIASTHAKFAESFIKVGLIPGDGGAWILPKIAGISCAAEMAFTGESIDAQTALKWGLVSQVVEPEALMLEANNLAQRVSNNPPQALKATKQLLRSAQNLNLEQTLDLSAAIQASLHQTEDHLEAVQAMIEKRAPKYKGQ
ncbi:crotonase/enoyl-CoA hydratase family protein [Bermanella marisrubri]|uniref:Enoyl-CoA hydratase n=1 Tax=Bermanella marisrubri TaxID=207949 RepID=Q1N1N7_9GAMM|nr:crotonase/enoyl-CoA hydratase family protein [Bermanella marisrubri]EAT12244.1 enoyl-CoA hydratase [Oceanobacter sp. RED65] [Bermanella marisrubri]QIZ83712.1 crotonase/enoyl-CoA hydratase family protein [Bermanella marisrubri]